MKRTVSLVLLCLVAMLAAAKPVGPQRAVQVARNFVSLHVGNADNMVATVAYTHRQPQSGEASMYVVNFAVPSAKGEAVGGFVLVAADDVAHPVLGYSFDRRWPVSATKGAARAVPLAAQVTDYLDLLSSQIAGAIGSASPAPDTDSAAPQGNAGTADEWQRLLAANPTSLTEDPLVTVGPLIATSWGQGEYYNAFCPEDENGQGGHTVVGCVATAMAQILKYWSYPERGRGSLTYNDNSYGTQSADFGGTTYDYARMPAALSATSTTEEVEAVARLMYHCGVACNMEYGHDASSAIDLVARAGLISFFRFSPDANYVERRRVSEEEWHAMLRQQLDARQPVFYGGSSDHGGHAFICDGYRSDGTFHFNFGWYGNADGWFLTDAIEPRGTSYSEGQSIIVNLVPDPASHTVLNAMQGTSTFTVDEPLEVYHLMGHNTHTGLNYSVQYYSNILFLSADPSRHLVLDIHEHSNHTVTIRGSEYGSVLRTLRPMAANNLTPVISPAGSLFVGVQGRLTYSGFKLSVSPDDGNFKTVSLRTNDIFKGTVSGAGRYHVGIHARLTATPVGGFHFVRWSDGNRQNPREILVEDDISLTAIFDVTLEACTLRCCTGQTLRYALDNTTHTATVTGHEGACEGPLIVPSFFTIDGERFDVTAIGDRAFQGCTGLTLVTLPRGIATVGEEAFSGRSSITDILIL